MSEIRDSLAQVQELLERATFGVLRADGHKDWFQPTVMLHSGDDIVARYHHGAPDFTCTVGKYEYELRNAEAVEACVNFVMQHGPELMKMLDRHGAGDAEDAPAIEPCVGAEKAESLCVHCFSSPHMWGMICCSGYWNDPRTEMLTETQARAKRAARAGERG